MSIMLVVGLIAILGIFFRDTRPMALIAMAILLFAGAYFMATFVIIGWIAGYQIKRKYFSN